MNPNLLTPTSFRITFGSALLLIPVFIASSFYKGIAEFHHLLLFAGLLAVVLLGMALIRKNFNRILREAAIEGQEARLERSARLRFLEKSIHVLGGGMLAILLAFLYLKLAANGMNGMEELYTAALAVTFVLYCLSGWFASLSVRQRDLDDEGRDARRERLFLLFQACALAVLTVLVFLFPMLYARFA